MLTSHLTSIEPWQHTLAGEFDCVGRGLHSGQRVSMRLRPASPGTGIRFKRLDVSGQERVVRAHWRNVVESELCTTIANQDGVTVRTIEHLLAALRGCNIDNAVIELDGPEVPIMDGSAAPYVAILRQIGATRQLAARRALLITQPVVIADGDRFATLLPALQPRITVEIDFPDAVIGRQRYSQKLDADLFAREIAPARTFGFAGDLQSMRKSGLATGGSLHNAILVGKHGIVNEEGLRFSNEFVRHKLLDCMGDLALLGMPVIGHLVAYKPGHKLCHRLLRALDNAGDAAQVIHLGVDAMSAAANLPRSPMEASHDTRASC